MGNVVQSCTYICEKYSQDKTENNNEKSSNAYDDEDDCEDDDFLNEDERVDIIRKETRKCFSYSSDIKNMKVRANLIVQKKTDPWSIYEEIGDLGYGSYGIVKKISLKSSPDKIRALKIIPKEYLIEGVDTEKLLDEIIILKNLEHPNIMKLYEFFEDDKSYYMVSEFCDQGDLFDKMQKLNWMTEIVVKFLMEQVLNAIAYLHSKGVIHGDIKLENIMLYTTTKSARERFTMINKQLSYDPSLQMEIENSYREGYENKSDVSSKTMKVVNNMLNYEIKLIDFGCSKLFSKHGERKSGIIGTSIYCSPEVIDDLYDEKCDEWSCGILMYLLLCGEPPFDGETDKEIFEKIKKCKYDFSLPQFKNVSDNCKDLIKKLLEPKISRRIKAKDALKHPFFTESFNPEEALTKNKDITIIKRLETLKIIQSQFHQAIISYMSSNYISKDEEKKLRTIFRYIDYDNKSFLTKSKIEKVLKEYGILCTEEKLQNIINVLDVDKDGVVEYQEFIQGLCDKRTLFNEFNLKNIFTIMDEDNKGYLTSDDIKNFVFPNKTVNEEAITEYLKQFGMKIDDKLKFDSFVYIIQNNCSLEDKDNININEIINSKNINEKSKKEKLAKKYSLSAYSSENDNISCYSEISDIETDEKK